MKKICSIIALFGILILISNTVFANEYWEKENKRREKLYESELDKYMQNFMTEETPEEDRITSYEFSGYGYADKGETDKELNVSISFRVTPVNENNTTWNKHDNICFAVFSKVDDEYVLERISRYPDNYDEFLKRFEEYKNSPKNTEIVTIQGEEQNSLANQEMEKINNNLVIGFSIVFVLSGVLLVIFIKNKH